MPTIVDFPTIVQEALTVLGDVVDPEAALPGCAAYRTGEMAVSGCKVL
jgi:hypothetical protein